MSLADKSNKILNISVNIDDLPLGDRHISDIDQGLGPHFFADQRLPLQPPELAAASALETFEQPQTPWL